MQDLENIIKSYSSYFDRFTSLQYSVTPASTREKRLNSSTFLILNEVNFNCGNRWYTPNSFFFSLTLVNASERVLICFIDKELSYVNIMPLL